MTQSETTIAQTKAGRQTGMPPAQGASCYYRVQRHFTTQTTQANTLYQPLTKTAFDGVHLFEEEKNCFKNGLELVRAAAPCLERIEAYRNILVLFDSHFNQLCVNV